MKNFEVVKINKTKEGKVISVEVVDKEFRNMSVSFKWDGCIDLHKYNNGFTVDDEYTEEKKFNTDYIHICDINEMIKQLQEIKSIAEDMFDEDDFNNHWE